MTVANEPNSTALTMAEYETLNRALDAQLVARGLREQIRMMGGDLVSTSQRAWFAYIAANMNDLFDAYSVHVYWDYWNTPFFKEPAEGHPQDRDRGAAGVGPQADLRDGVRRPRQELPGKPNVESGYWDDGTDIARTNVAAFQQLWFDLAAAQLGFTGSVKWDAYWGRYHGTYNSLYSLIGPASEGWPLFPGLPRARACCSRRPHAAGRSLQVGPWNDDDWKVGVVDPAEKELAAYAGDGGQLTLMGLDTRGRDLNTVSPESPEYSIGGLPANTAFGLALWNASGDGKNSIAGTVTTNAAGVARFEVPLHAAFSLTTVPVS